MGNSTPCKIVTPKNFILKLCTRDYVREVTAMQILVLIGAVGASTQIGEYYHLVTFLTVLSLPFFLDPTPRSNRWTDFHVLRLKRRVSVQGWSFLGSER